MKEREGGKEGGGGERDREKYLLGF